MKGLPHDGERVKARCAVLGLTGSEFAERMNWSSRKVYYQFKVPDWTAYDLNKASQVLELDLLKIYRPQESGAENYVMGILIRPEVLRSEQARQMALNELRKRMEEE